LNESETKAKPGTSGPDGLSDHLDDDTSEESLEPDQSQESNNDEPPQVMAASSDSRTEERTDAPSENQFDEPSKSLTEAEDELSQLPVIMIPWRLQHYSTAKCLLK